MRVTAQPYALAIFAGIIAVLANHIAASHINEQALVQRQRELRTTSYSAFLEKIDHQASPEFSQLLRFSTKIENIATDSELQAFEDDAAELLKNHDIHELHWQFTSASVQLRLFGSQRVIEICNDIQKAILQNDYAIDWSLYSPEATSFHKHWKEAQESGSPYGTEEQISTDERLMIATVGKLIEALINQQRLEALSTDSTRSSQTVASNAVF